MKRVYFKLQLGRKDCRKIGVKGGKFKVKLTYII